jgi:hypothetical protein
MFINEEKLKETITERQMHCDQRSMTRVGHGIPKVSPGPTVLNPADGPPLKRPYTR